MASPCIRLLRVLRGFEWRIAARVVGILHRRVLHRRWAVAGIILWRRRALATPLVGRRVHIILARSMLVRGGELLVRVIHWWIAREPLLRRLGRGLCREDVVLSCARSAFASFALRGRAREQYICEVSDGVEATCQPRVGSE